MRLPRPAKGLTQLEWPLCESVGVSRLQLEFRAPAPLGSRRRRGPRRLSGRLRPWLGPKAAEARGRVRR
jgi:hypothetical protein